MFHAVKLKKKNLLALCLLFAALLAAAYVRLRYPLDHLELIENGAVRYGLEPALVCAVIHAESKFNREAVSPKNARGLMQLTKATADWSAEQMRLAGYSYENILDPALNIEIGCWYLSRLLKTYKGDMDLALAAYNAGGGNVGKWLRDSNYSPDGLTLAHIPFEETRNYIRRVKWNYRIYSFMLTGKI